MTDPGKEDGETLLTRSASPTEEKGSGAAAAAAAGGTGAAAAGDGDLAAAAAAAASDDGDAVVENGGSNDDDGSNKKEEDGGEDLLQDIETLEGDVAAAIRKENKEKNQERGIAGGGGSPAATEQGKAEGPSGEAAGEDAGAIVGGIAPSAAAEDLLAAVAHANDAILAAADEVGVLTSSPGAGGAGTDGQLQQQNQQQQEMMSVTAERKEELLLKARKSRNKWIAKVAAPYRADKVLPGSAGKDDPWHEEARLSSIRSTHAARRLPSALPVLSALYGLDCGEASPAQVADRIQSVLGHADDGGGGGMDERKAVPTAQEVLQAELESKEGDDDDNGNDNSYLREYSIFWTQLQDPACSMLVQGMRNFCGKLKDVHDKAELIAKLKSYQQAAFQSMQSHALWKKKNDGSISAAAADEHQRLVLRRCLESFLYGQCYPQIEKVLWTKDAQQKESEWMERLNDLQFVTPQHLEISCLTTPSSDGGSLELDEVLQGPVTALRSVGLYYSAYDKLQRILALYRAVNVSLSAALNRGKGDDEGKSKKLPSADDVLPTIILTVLLAKPERLHLDLEIVEDFSPPEYLRGEAGYAFTNLYGAVHFLLDLDLNEPKSLSIGADEFRKGLESSRAKTESRLLRSSVLATAAPVASAEESTADILELPSVNIPPIEVRKARLRGEDVDLDWALRWTAEHQPLSAAAADDSLSAGERKALHAAAALTTAAEQGGSSGCRTDDYMGSLPPGFHRSYSFLTTRPEEVKLSDLPKLLSEYRMLVHTTEVLLAERAEKARAERRKRSVVAQHDLFARVRQVDPSLLPKK